jgi:copper chaperone CopZ
LLKVPDKIDYEMTRIMMKKIEMQVSGIKCGNCSKKIIEKIELMDMVNNIEVSVDEGLVKIDGSDKLSAMTIKKSIEELGFVVEAMKKLS